MTGFTLAVILGQRLIAYAELQRDLASCVQWLSEKLTADDQRVAISLRNDYWHWVSVLALLQLGKSCATVYSSALLPTTLRDSFQVWLGDGPMHETGRVVEFSAEAVKAVGAAGSTGSDVATPPGFHIKVAARAQRLLLTSGTTGQPKVVVLSAGDIRSRLQAAAQQYGDHINADTRLLTLMGIDTIGAFLITLVTWLRGGTVLFGVPVPGNHGNHQIPLEHSNLMSVSPARLKELLDKTQGVWPGREVRQVRVGGARLHAAVRDAALKRIGYRVQTTYGSTELGLVATCDAASLDEYPGAAGRVFENVQVQIVDRQDHPLPAGAQGLVRCKTPGMASGYEGEAQSSQFREGWFYPGDIGSLSADGMLVITGRDTDVINLGGLKLSAVEWETQLQHLEGVEDVCVVGIDEDGSNTLAVAVVCSDGLDLTELRNQISALMQRPLPFHLVRVPALPRNAMGKLPRTIIGKKLASIVGLSAGTETRKAD